MKECLLLILNPFILILNIDTNARKNVWNANAKKMQKTRKCKKKRLWTSGWWPTHELKRKWGKLQYGLSKRKKINLWTSGWWLTHQRKRKWGKLFWNIAYILSLPGYLVFNYNYSKYYSMHKFLFVRCGCGEILNFVEKCSAIGQ